MAAPTDAYVSFVLVEDRWASSGLSSAVVTRHPAAQDEDVQTLLVSEAAAAAEATRRRDLAAEYPYKLTLSHPERGLGLAPGQVWTLPASVLGQAAQILIQGAAENDANNRTQIAAWLKFL